MSITALIIRIIQQMLRDKRTLALLFVAPLLILSLMYVLFNSNSVAPQLGVLNIDQQLVTVIENNGIDSIECDEHDEAFLIDNNYSGLLEIKEGVYILTLLNSEPSESKELLIKLKQSLTSYGLQESSSNLYDIEINYIYGDENTTFFDVLSPVLIGYFVFFFVFLISGIGLLRERTTGTLERLMSTPIRRKDVVFGYLLGYGLFALIQTILVVLFSVHILGITLVGTLGNVILINLVLAIVALTLGILLSTFAASEFQMMQFIPIVIIPQFFFAGVFPIEGMAKWLQMVGRIMPIYYASRALKNVMYKGLGMADIFKDLSILILFAVVFIVLNIMALKKYRKL